MDSHLIFYDADCDLCYRTVLHLIKLDKNKELLFAPLEGETAKEVLMGANARYIHENSLVLFENFRTDHRRIYIRSQAVFRIYWLLGNRWLGWLSHLPQKFCDLLYQTVAKHRHRLRFGWTRSEFQGDRFLP